MTTSLRTQTLVLTALLAGLGACSTVGPNKNLFLGTGTSFRINGLSISELQADSFGPGGASLTVKSRSDAKAMDRLIKYYSDKAIEGAVKGDAEQFAVAWHLGKKLTKARVEQLVGTDAFVRNLADQKTGVASLPGGARVYLPRNLYEGTTSRSKPRRLSFEEHFPSPDTPAVVNQLAWNGAIQVAALGDGVKGLLNTVMAATTPEERLSAGAVEAMKVGSAYSVRDSHGNKYIVEKTADGVVLHNPDSGPTKVDLNQINFMPLLDRPEAFRYEASRISANIDAALVRHAAQNKGGVYSYHTIAPNRIRLGDSYAYLTADGHYSATDRADARQLYGSNRAFRFAVDANSLERLERDPRYQAFKSNCSHRPWLAVHGDAMEYATYSCRNRAGETLYSRTYLLGDNFSVQSWDSVLRDQNYLNQMKDADQNAQLVEAAMAFVPFLGNVDGAARCANSKALSYQVAHSHFSASVSADVRKYVEYKPERETPSAVSGALDCAQALAVSGGVRNVAKKLAKGLKMDNILTSPGFAKTTDQLLMFDTKLFTRNGIDSMVETANTFTSPGAAFLAKAFYDTAQRANDITGLSEAIYPGTK